ncbi:M20/M25/M40 family metallo-hydrolase [Lignipirellula cremea]|uniref:Aminopeptidase S n=1 Tax=Lignipirellula cremea TaxID=2528010 RepID=A0A518E3U1_9BACT|nr:M20/M25/M40 family metallo-hydrolase [Lignipirellula cremea]QDU98765.1 Aminopeptidase S [Lignipirellula cremea]
MKLFRTICLSACLLSWATIACAENLSLPEATRTITEKELKTYVEMLADDTFEGRGAGSRGGRAAGNFLIQAMGKHGLKPAGESGFVQPFDGQLRNILGLMEGSDPALKHEVIVIGAHYDHVGYGTSKNSRGPLGYVHNGADDNASGVSALLELMQAFAAGEKPKRSVLFAFWDGEEAGLLGSKHWTAHPTIALKRIGLMINVDMIGRLRDRTLIVYGWRSGAGLRRLVSEANAETDLLVDFDWEMKDNSDHHSFYLKKIPVVMLHTGLHDDYHTPHDDVHLINTAGMEEVTRLMFQLTFAAANQPERIVYREASEKEGKTTQKLAEAPLTPPQPRLGVNWKNAENGVEITAVSPRQAADRAGLLAGDRVQEIDGRPVSDTRQLLAAILTARSTAELVIARQGVAEPLRQRVELEGSPVRVGLSWRSDDADPRGMMVTQVISGSPAYWSGLKLLDRIRAVNGTPIESSDLLLEQLSTLPSPIELVVERKGRTRRIRIDLDEVPLRQAALKPGR